jgi:hypothetical protein
MKLELEGKSVDVRVVFETNRGFADVFVRSVKNMTGDLANEGCYEPDLHGNTEPLCIYRIDFRTWLLSSMPLTSEERQRAVKLFGQRPRHMESLLAADFEKSEAEEAEAEQSASDDEDKDELPT